MMGVMASPLEIPVETSMPVDDFNRWMVSEQRRVFLLCYRMLQDTDEADTATQDTFLKAHKALNQPAAKPLDDPSKWVTRIAVNTCLDRLRSRSWKFWKKRPQPEDEELILNLTASSEPDAEDRYFAGEIQQRLNESLALLSPQQRAVFALRHFEDRRLDEIAEILDLQVGTVKAHMARALAKLRNLLQDLYIESENRRRSHGGTR
jgi:RNA polymerase sigma-70 factor, ECF subfamily